MSFTGTFNYRGLYSFTNLFVAGKKLVGITPDTLISDVRQQIQDQLGLSINVLTCRYQGDHSLHVLEEGPDYTMAFYGFNNEHMTIHLNEEVGDEERYSSCSICSHIFIPTNGPIVETECHHFFHENCLRTWIESRPPGGATCPLCRTENVHYNVSRRTFIFAEDEKDDGSTQVSRPLQPRGLAIFGGIVFTLGSVIAGTAAGGPIGSYVGFTIPLFLKWIKVLLPTIVVEELFRPITHGPYLYNNIYYWMITFIILAVLYYSSTIDNLLPFTNHWSTIPDEVLFFSNIGRKLGQVGGLLQSSVLATRTYDSARQWVSEIRRTPSQFKELLLSGFLLLVCCLYGYIFTSIFSGIKPKHKIHSSFSLGDIPRINKILVTVFNKPVYHRLVKDCSNPSITILDYIHLLFSSLSVKDIITIHNFIETGTTKMKLFYEKVTKYIMINIDLHVDHTKGMKKHSKHRNVNRNKKSRQKK